MQISLNLSGNPNKRSQHALQTHFDKLRKQLERQEQLNHKLATELDALVTRYEAQLREIDIRHLAPLSRLAERLIEFFGRKSLSNGHREELGDWITGTLQRIHRVDGAAAEALHGRFRQAIAATFNLTEAELEAQAEAFTETVEAAFEEMFDSDDNLQPDLFADDAFFDQDTDDMDEWCETDDLSEPPEDITTQARGFMDGSWARGLFRRAAQALHPDREPDPERRQHKQKLMQQLLAAREQADILTLLRLYGEGIGTDELALAETEMAQACQLMEVQLEELHDAREEIIYDHPLHALVYELFYSPTRKIREQRFKIWQRELHAEAEAMARLPDELRNLGVLKAFLELRREQQIFNQLDNMIF